MPEIVPATAELVRQVTDKPMPRTLRALAVVEDEKVLGVTGFYPENGHLVWVGHMTDEARAEMNRDKFTYYKLALVQCAKQIMAMAAERRLPVYAHADPDIQGSDTLLKHLGFTHAFGGIYNWSPE